MIDVPDSVRCLEVAEPRYFKDLLSDPMERGRPGVYTIWYYSRFLYVGEAHKDRNDTDNRQAQGVYGRLLTHAGARPTSDLWLSVCERFIIPTLRPEDLAAFARGDQKLKDRLSAFIAEHIRYRAITTATGEEARSIESHVRRYGLTTAGLPLFNAMIRA